MQQFESIKTVLEIVSKYYAETQAIYLFGSAAENKLRPDSDIDIALLLPHDIAKSKPSLAMTPLQHELENSLQREVDLINLRQVSTVFQYIIVNRGRTIFCATTDECKLFEMLVWSFYQKLNEERADILATFLQTGKTYGL